MPNEATPLLPASLDLESDDVEDEDDFEESNVTDVEDFEAEAEDEAVGKGEVGLDGACTSSS
ncbi:hypothetical protein GGH95_006213, partial [Coemansia sp. RSA 1836]